MERYFTVRSTSEFLCRNLKPEDTVAQSMIDASPVKWHLAHTSWFFETFILEKVVPDYRAFNPEYRTLFNSYYNIVGEQYLRANRGLITRPDYEEVINYRKYVDKWMTELLESSNLHKDVQNILEVGLQHEQQHQELMLTDIKHLFSFNPLCPSYEDCPDPDHVPQQPACWQTFRSGTHVLGNKGDVFAFDNEMPAHKVHIADFELASRPVSNGEFLLFMEESGYSKPEFWLSDAWLLVQQNQWQCPLYWQEVDGEWHTFTLGGLRPVRKDEPVTHISYYEADAYARWANARLPTEQEWELVAMQQQVDGNFVESGYLHPMPAEKTDSMQKMFGDIWEWTQSPYVAYPGFTPAAGELAEYNGKFMCNQMVLRGGSCVTPRSHIRATYRNFFPPSARWQFSGLRLARNPV